VQTLKQIKVDGQWRRSIALKKVKASEKVFSSSSILSSLELSDTQVHEP
jgi:hypothetical protein